MKEKHEANRQQACLMHLNNIIAYEKVNKKKDPRYKEPVMSEDRKSKFLTALQALARVQKP